RKYLPMWHLSPYPQGDSPRRRIGERGQMIPSQGLRRREFLKVGAAAGGGLLISFYLPELSLGQPSTAKQVFSPNAFLRIGTDDIVTVILGKSEMGEGIYTSLPRLVAEELEADWSKIRVESAP